MVFSWHQFTPLHVSTLQLARDAYSLHICSTTIESFSLSVLKMWNESCMKAHSEFGCFSIAVHLWFMRASQNKHYIYYHFSYRCKPLPVCSTDSSKLCNLGSSPCSESGEWQQRPVDMATMKPLSGEILKERIEAEKPFLGMKLLPLLSAGGSISAAPGSCICFP